MVENSKCKYCEKMFDPGIGRRGRTKEFCCASCKNKFRYYGLPKEEWERVAWEVYNA